MRQHVNSRFVTQTAPDECAPAVIRTRARATIILQAGARRTEKIEFKILECSDDSEVDQ